MILLSPETVQVTCVCFSAALLNSSGKRRWVKLLERVRQRKAFENALTQCHEVMERFRGSSETLMYIQRVEESLKRLVAESN